MSTEQWPTVVEAAQQLGISERNVQRLIATGMLERRERPVPGRVPVAVVNPHDVATHVARKNTADGQQQRDRRLSRSAASAAVSWDASVRSWVSATTVATRAEWPHVRA